MINYFEVRQKIALSLKKSGFRVKSPFKVPLGWIDVVFFKKGPIGIDICIEKPQNSFRELLSYPFKHRIVLNLTNEDVDKKGFTVLSDLKELDVFLNENFNANIDLDIPIKGKHIEFSEYFLNFGSELELRGIIDALIFLYISKGVLEEHSDEYYFKALKTITPRLKEFNLVFTSSKGVKPKYHMLYLNSDGMKIAKDALISRILEKEISLRSLVEKYGVKTYIIFTAIQRDSCLIYENIKLNRKASFKDLLLDIKGADLHSLIKRLAFYKYGQTPLSMFCYILTYIALYDIAVDVLRSLERLGLASKVPIYSPYGIKVGESFNVPDEVVDFILKISDANIDEDIVNEVALLSMLLKTRLEEAEILQNTGIPHEKIEQIIDLLQKKKLIKNGKLTNSYEDFLKIRIAKAVEKVLC